MSLRTLRGLRKRALKLRRLLAVAPYRRALRHGVAAAVEHDLTPLPPGLRTVIDAGANRGQFALVAAHRWPDATLICFEPLPAACATLARVLAGHPRLRVVDAALSAAAGTAALHVSRADDSSSLLAITDRQTATFPGTDEVGTITVRTARLDAELTPAGAMERPALLKIDVQGAELDVLRGATGVLDRIDAVLVECSFVEFYAGQALADAVIRLLHEHGFALSGLASPTTDAQGRIVQADLLLQRSATAPLSVR